MGVWYFYSIALFYFIVLSMHTDNTSNAATQSQVLLFFPLQAFLPVPFPFSVATLLSFLSSLLPSHLSICTLLAPHRGPSCSPFGPPVLLRIGRPARRLLLGPLELRRDGEAHLAAHGLGQDGGGGGGDGLVRTAQRGVQLQGQGKGEERGRERGRGRGARCWCGVRGGREWDRVRV